MVSYNTLDKQIPLLIEANSSMFKAMQQDKVKLTDIEKVWLELFQQKEKYDANHLIQCLRMLYESAWIAHNEVSRNDFSIRQEEKELRKELNYKEAGNYLGCSVSTIKRLVGQGKFKTKKYNSKTVKITVAELESFKASCGGESVTQCDQ